MLLRVNEQRNILHEIRKWKANWIRQVLRWNCLLKQVTEEKIKGEIEVTRRWGRRHKKLLDDLKDRKKILSFEGGGSRSHYVEASFWRRRWTCRQTEYWMNGVLISLLQYYWFQCTNHNVIYQYSNKYLLWIKHATMKIWGILSPTTKETGYSNRRFWCSYILFIIIIGGILLLYIYIYVYIYIYNKTSIKQNFLTIKQTISGSESG